MCVCVCVCVCVASGNPLLCGRMLELSHIRFPYCKPQGMNDYQPLPMSPVAGGYSHSATGASTRVQLAKEELICALCMSFYKNPLSLQCLHSYCEECLVGLHKSSSRFIDTVQCPECRARTLLPEEGIQGKWSYYCILRFVALCLYQFIYRYMPAIATLAVSKPSALILCGV